MGKSNLPIEYLCSIPPVCRLNLLRSWVEWDGWPTSIVLCSQTILSFCVWAAGYLIRQYGTPLAYHAHKIAQIFMASASFFLAPTQFCSQCAVKLNWHITGGAVHVWIGPVWLRVKVEKWFGILSILWSVPPMTIGKDIFILHVQFRCCDNYTGQ